MTDRMLPMSPYCVRYKRMPKEGLMSPNTVRVYNSAPRTVTLQIRDAKGFSNVSLSIAQVSALMDILADSLVETFPPLSHEDLLTIVRAEP